MRINYQRSHIGMLASVFALMGLTLYMAFAFPYSLLHFKQSETTEIKAVIIVGRHGEVTPSRETYFDTFGEEPPESWFELGGQNQLTARGKERMYLLGKFLKLRYYERLLAGNPRKVYARSDNSDRALESAQALLAGLNPPKNKWLWSSGSATGGDSVHEFATSWQPKAVHTTHESQDELLSSQTRCLELDTLRASWKNSSRYSQLLNEFRHDLEILRQNTGLEFEDDLEMLSNIEDQLRARHSFDERNAPAWYTSTLAQRLAHIADVTAGCRFSSSNSQRLIVGRLLNTLVTNIFSKIRSDLTAGVSLLNERPSRDDDDEAPTTSSGSEFGFEFNATRSQPNRQWAELNKNKPLPPDEKLRLKLGRQNEPNMFIYMTDKHHLSALMSALKVYASQPHYGAALIIELHYDPVNQIHFLRLFLVNSASHNVLPEPVRVNPIACSDSVECSPQQFERNTKHLALDKETLSSLCSNMDKMDQEQPSPLPTSSPVELTTEAPPNSTFSELIWPTDRSDAQTNTTIPSTATPIYETTTTSSDQFELNDGIHHQIKSDDESIVHPTSISEPSSSEANVSTTIGWLTSGETTTNQTYTTTTQPGVILESNTTQSSLDSASSSNTTTTSEEIRGSVAQTTTASLQTDITTTEDHEHLFDNLQFSRAENHLKLVR